MPKIVLSVLSIDLAAGYKMTEVGIIPEDWQVKQICDVAEICGGGTPSTTEKSFWGGDINWFTPAEINDSVVFVTESERKITKEGLKQSSAKLLPVGSILLTTRATIGTRAISKGIVSTNQGFQSLIPKEGTYIFLFGASSFLVFHNFINFASVLHLQRVRG